MTSPEASAVPPNSYESLLRPYDPDPYGYISQAIAAVQTIPSSAGLVPVAEFASDVGDPELMASCLPGMNSVERWRLFAYDSRQTRPTMTLPCLTTMGEKLALLESNAGYTEIPTIACIYAAQLETIPHGDGASIASHLVKLEKHIKHAGRYDRMGVVAYLCRIGLLDDAKRFSRYAHPDDWSECAALAHLQEQMIRGKQLSRCTTAAELSALRQLDPMSYVQQRQAAANKKEPIAWQPADVLAFLQAGETAKARTLYEHVVCESAAPKTARARMALWMARYQAVDDHDHTEEDAASRMTGCRNIVELVGTPFDTPETVVATKAEAARYILGTCALVSHMPYSSSRIALSLELIDMQQYLFPANETVRAACHGLAYKNWNVAKATLAESGAQKLSDYPEVIRWLQEDYVDAGLDILLDCEPKGHEIKSGPRYEGWFSHMVNVVT